MMVSYAAWNLYALAEDHHSPYFASSFHQYYDNKKGIFQIILVFYTIFYKNKLYKNIEAQKGSKRKNIVNMRFQRSKNIFIVYFSGNSIRVHLLMS